MRNLLCGFLIGYVINCAALLFSFVIVALLINFCLGPLIVLIRFGAVAFPPGSEVLLSLKGAAAAAAMAALILTVAGMLQKTPD